MILWEQQDLKRGAQKKYPYKGKQQNFPLRSNNAPRAESDAMKPKTSTQKKASSQVKPGAKPANQRRSDTKQTNVKKKEATGTDSKGKAGAGTVTLTQKEFDAILETIGQLAFPAETSAVKDDTQATATLNQRNIEAEKENRPKKLITEDYIPPIEENIRKANENGGARNEDPFAVGGTANDALAQQHIHKAPMTRAELKKLEWEKDKAAAAERQRQMMTSKQIQLTTHIPVNQAALPIGHTPGPSQTHQPSPMAPGPGPAATAPHDFVPKAHLTKAELKRQEWENDKASEAERKHQTALSQQTQLMTEMPVNQATLPVGHAPDPSQPHQPSHMAPGPGPAATAPHGTQDFIPKAHMTKAELKRQEWARQKEENAKITDFNPWGRPGAGAPVKDDEGYLLADYHTRKSPPEPARQVATQPPLPQFSQATAPSVNGPHLDAQPPPAAIRSSFAVGAVSSNENRYASAKEREKQQWLADLELQREDQRQRKLRDKVQPGGLEDTWADRLNPPYHPKGLPPQHSGPGPGVPPGRPMDDLATTASRAPGQDAGYPGDLGTRVGSAPVGNPIGQQQDITTSPTHHTFLRGQNVPLDPGVAKEQDEKRRKQLDHQEYIRRQIEEKDRLKREEREKRIREEQREEDRLSRERQEIQGQFVSERERVRQKQDAEQRKLEVLKEALDAAQAQAELEKHQRRIRKLQQAGHDVTHLNANFEDGAKNNVLQGDLEGIGDPQGQTVVDPAKATPRVEPPGRDAPVVHPTYIPGLHPTPRDMKVMPTHVPGLDLGVDSHAPSVVTRESPKREFGIQTDLAREGAQVPTSRESTDVEYQGPVNEKGSRRVRMRSAPREIPRQGPGRSAPQDPGSKPGVPPPGAWGAETGSKKRPVKISERPKWGCPNQQKTKPVKQSEKYPFYEQRKERVESNKTQRQRDLQKMVELNAQIIPRTTTVASRARSRSPPPEVDPTAVDSYTPYSRTRQRSLSPDDVTSRQGHRSRVDTQHSNNPRSHSPGKHVGGHVASRRPPSPPIPAIKHRQEATPTAEAPASHRNKYKDSGPVNAPLQNGDFVPFIRSSNVLDPAHADSPIPASREPSAMVRARHVYQQELDPATFGRAMKPLHDPAPPKHKARPSNDPIMNPSVVTDRPTSRQVRVLQQLSDLRRGLMQKQRELEMGIGAPSE